MSNLISNALTATVAAVIFYALLEVGQIGEAIVAGLIAWIILLSQIPKPASDKIWMNILQALTILAALVGSAWLLIGIGTAGWAIFVAGVGTWALACGDAYGN